MLLPPGGGLGRGGGVVGGSGVVDPALPGEPLTPGLPGEPLTPDRPINLLFNCTAAIQDPNVLSNKD